MGPGGSPLGSSQSGPAFAGAIYTCPCCPQPGAQVSRACPAWEDAGAWLKHTGGPRQCQCQCLQQEAPRCRRTGVFHRGGRQTEAGGTMC